MPLELRITTDPKDPAVFIAKSIIKHLEEGKKVLWFVTGGSSVAVAHEASLILNKHPKLNNLVIMMTDERYGELDHPNSNWHQLVKLGFDLPFAKVIPILDGTDIETTTRNFNSALETELGSVKFKIGLFGIGADGHTAGILPNTVAVDSQDLACFYHTEKFDRITITPKTILELDEVVIFAQGKEKFGVIGDLEKNNLDLTTQPAQILKQVSKVTLFSNYEL